MIGYAEESCAGRYLFSVCPISGSLNSKNGVSGDQDAEPLLKQKGNSYVSSCSLIAQSGRAEAYADQDCAASMLTTLFFSFTLVL